MPEWVEYPSDARFVGAVGERLVAELVSFGRLASGMPSGEEELNRFLPHAEAAVSFLDIAGNEFGVRLRAHFPCWIRPVMTAVPWIVGYARSDGRIQDMLDGRLGVWRRDATGSGAPTLLLRASLEVMLEAGVVAAIDWILDLLESGAVIRWQTVVMVLGSLIMAASQTDSDAEAVEGFLGAGARQQDVRDSRTHLDPFRFPPEPVRGRGARAFERVFERVAEATGKVREATSLDAWLEGQCLTSARVNTIRVLSSVFVPDPKPIGLVSFLNTYDELGADASAFNIRAGVNDPSTMIPTDEDPHLWPEYREAYAESWKEQLYERRLRIPMVLRERILYGGSGPLPGEWTRWSLRIANALTALRPEVVAKANSPAVTRDGDIGSSWEADLRTASTESERLVVQGHLSEALTQLEGLCNRFSWSRRLRYLRALALDRSGDSEGALELLSEVIAADLEDPDPWNASYRPLLQIGSKKEASFAYKMYSNLMGPLGPAAWC